MALEVEQVASFIVERNPKLVEFINNNNETYKPVRAQINRMVGQLSNKFNDGKFIPNQELHKLTWEIINQAEGNDSEFTITLNDMEEEA